MGYPTTADLVAASSVTELTALDSEAQDALRLAAIAAIEEFTGQRFSEVEKVVTLDGQGANVLYLPERLARLDALTVNSAALTTAVLSDAQDRLYFPSGVGLGYYEQALAEVSDYHFPSGFGNVEIDGAWGWLDEEFPEEINLALRLDMEDTALADTNILSQTVTAYRKLGLRGISQGNLSADLGGAPGLSHRVQRLLARYVWHGQLGALA